MFKARDLFNNYLVELQGQHCDAIKEQKHVAADIYFEFAQVFFPSARELSRLNTCSIGVRLSC